MRSSTKSLQSMGLQVPAEGKDTHKNTHTRISQLIDLMGLGTDSVKNRYIYLCDLGMLPVLLILYRYLFQTCSLWLEDIIL